MFPHFSFNFEIHIEIYFGKSHCDTLIYRTHDVFSLGEQKKNVKLYCFKIWYFARFISLISCFCLSFNIYRGKFGVVFKCTEKSTGKKFAAKFVTTARKEDREDVEREVDIMRSLQHKRLLQLYDAFDDGKKEFCLVLEL